MTVRPLIVNTETVPSMRFATSASVPARLTDTPEAPAPARSVARTARGDALRSITETVSSGMTFVRSAGSIFCAAVTNASDPSVVIATLDGGPTIDVGTRTSPTTFG